jgi:SAM-dependent methyltransferase
VRSSARRVFRRLPQSIQGKIRSVRNSRSVRRRLRRVRWGSLRRLEPVSPRWGSERGRAVDRHYIDAFLARHAEHSRGRVLEVRDDEYTRRFGRDVSSVDIVDIDPRNDEATIIADLADPSSLPAGAFDCVIVPQTLVYVRDLTTALENLWQSLAPGGTLLVTNPAISRVDPDAPADDRWHFMPAGLEELIQRTCPDAEFSVEAGGNPLVATAFLQGIAAEELRRDELDARHPLFPVVVMAVVRKPGG